MPDTKHLFEEIEELDPVSRENLMDQLWLLYPGSPSANYIRPEHPGIVKTPDVCGGSARLIRTRIPIWTLVQMLRSGVSESDILRSFPRLRAADLVQAWEYSNHHSEEITRDILENESA